LTYQTKVLTAPVRVSGAPIADLLAATSGSDSDWVVKLIDVFPDEYRANPKWGLSTGRLHGHLSRTLSGEFRTRLSDSVGQAPALSIRIATVNHVFLPGHRIMVQIQSSWFPLYDRNPQTYVPNIFSPGRRIT